MVQWPEGVRRYYLTNKAVFRTQEGAIGGIIGSTMEITERKRSEEALYKSEMYNRSLIEHLPQRIFLKDCNSVYISCNVNYARDLGIEPEQITGKDDFDFYPRKLADSYRSDDRTVIASGMSKDVEERYIVGGQEKWVHTVKVPYRDESGKVIGVLGIFDDVSERKAAEAAIQESEAKFRSYIEHAPLAVLVSDREGRLLDFNPSAVNFLGCDADKLLGMNILDLPAEDDRETALHDFTILLEEGHLEGEYRLRSRDGQVAWVSLHAVMITDKLVLAYCRDITGHKRREAAEGVSHRFLQITHEHSEIMPLLGEFVSEIKKYTGCDAVGIRVLDDEGNIPYQAYEGFSQKFFDSESPLSIKSDRCMCINVIKGDIDPSLPFYTEGGSFLVNATSRFLASVSEEEKGQTRNVCNLEGYETVGLFPFRKNGRILGLIHVADHREDMVPPHVATVLEEAALQLGTAFERIYAEHQLKESEAKFRSYVQNAPEAILVQTRGLWSYVNPAAMKLLGASSKDELIGRSPLEILHPDYRESVKERMRLINVHKKSVAAQEQKFIKLDGTIVDVESLAVPVRYENEDGALVFVRDISERRKAEEERARLEVQLRQAQKLESIGQLAAGIAHEINTPAQYVGDNTRFLQEACADFERVFVLYNQLLEHLKSREQAKEFVEKIEKTAEEVDLQYLREEAPKAVIQSLDGIERISRIVRAMKEFSHPGTDTKTAIDLNRAIESTITVARNEWKYVAEMETDLDPSLPLVPCLPAEINQVILNMIINASHAIADVVKKGGSDRKGTIKITTHTRDNYAQISISDTGTGIPENIRSRIFDPFFTTKGVGKGSGQGLAISHSVVVDKHGGTITFDSEMGKGSVFVVRLPLDQGSETSGRA
jgi:PAS domain S-box-containing protein